MAVYVIADIEVLDRPSFEEYRQQVPATIMWWDSPEYAPLRALRVRSTRSHLVVTQGV